MNCCLPLLLICAFLLTACNSDDRPVARCDHNLPERGWKPPPYPGAQPDQTNAGALEGNRSFKTADAPAAVRAFYEEALQKQGWQLQAIPTPSPNTQVFVVDNCCFYGSVSVTAEQVENGQTTVTLHGGWSLGCG